MTDNRMNQTVLTPIIMSLSSLSLFQSIIFSAPVFLAIFFPLFSSCLSHLYHIFHSSSIAPSTRRHSLYQNKALIRGKLILCGALTILYHNVMHQTPELIHFFVSCVYPHDGNVNFAQGKKEQFCFSVSSQRVERKPKCWILILQKVPKLQFISQLFIWGHMVCLDSTQRTGGRKHEEWRNKRGEHATNVEGWT